LADLLQGDRLGEITRVLAGRSKVNRRLQIAARWHAKAYWSLEPEDAILALGIAFDSLLSEARPSPGRVLAERFAFLASAPKERPGRYRLFMNEYYAARSSVAHGAGKRAISAAFERKMAADLRVTIRQIAQLICSSAVESEEAYSQMFDNMKWGC
jgi:hypothetical protein